MERNNPFQQLNAPYSLMISDSSTNNYTFDSTVYIPISSMNNIRPIQLPHGFVPRPMDIVSGRGKGIWNQPGNCRFRNLIQQYIPKYKQATSKVQKTIMINSLVESIRKQGILFVKKDTKTKLWYEIGEQQAREKTSHSFRDYISICNSTDKKNRKSCTSKLNATSTQSKQAKYQEGRNNKQQSTKSLEYITQQQKQKQPQTLKSVEYKNNNNNMASNSSFQGSVSSRNQEDVFKFFEMVDIEPINTASSAKGDDDQRQNNTSMNTDNKELVVHQEGSIITGATKDVHHHYRKQSLIDDDDDDDIILSPSPSAASFASLPSASTSSSSVTSSDDEDESLPPPMPSLLRRVTNDDKAINQRKLKKNDTKSQQQQQQQQEEDMEEDEADNFLKIIKRNPNSFDDDLYFYLLEEDKEEEEQQPFTTFIEYEDNEYI